MDFLDSYDPIEAYKWFNIAEKLGDVDAIVKREFLASRMTSEQVLEADAVVQTWVQSHRTLFAGN